MNAIAKIIYDWKEHKDIALLLERNSEFYSTFAQADIATLSTHLTEEERSVLSEIVLALTDHIDALSLEASDIKEKIDASQKSMAACLSYGASSRTPRRKE